MQILQIVSKTYLSDGDGLRAVGESGGLRAPSDIAGGGDSLPDDGSSASRSSHSRVSAEDSGGRSARDEDSSDGGTHFD